MGAIGYRVLTTVGGKHYTDDVAGRSWTRGEAVELAEQLVEDAVSKYEEEHGPDSTYTASDGTFYEVRASADGTLVLVVEIEEFEMA